MLPKTTVSGSAMASVIFVPSKPVINALGVSCFVPGKYGGLQNNTVCLVQGAIEYGTTVSWSTVNTERYELWNGSKLWYSGTATSFRPSAYQPTGGTNTLTLKAYNGNEVSVYSINPEWIDFYVCDGACSGS